MINDDKNIFITTLAFVEVQEIDRAKFEWLGGDVAYRAIRGTLLLFTFNI